jgi:hypothetical protein
MDPRMRSTPVWIQAGKDYSVSIALRAHSNPVPATGKNEESSEMRVFHFSHSRGGSPSVGTMPFAWKFSI